MCITIELDVPVVTLDQREIGIAREILCSCPGDRGTSTAVPAGSSGGQNDLWLRVTRAAQRDLYIPFGEIAETRADGVQLGVSEAELAQHAWERPPVGLPVPA